MAGVFGSAVLGVWDFGISRTDCEFGVFWNNFLPRFECEFGDFRLPSSRAPCLGVLMLTIYPNQIGYVPVLGTEIFYTALLLAAVLTVICAKTRAELLLAGAAFGFATLTKAQTLFLPAALFTAWLLAAAIRARRFSCLGKVVIIYATMAVVILPWTIRNYLVFGEFIFISTNGGGTLLTGQ